MLDNVASDPMGPRHASLTLRGFRRGQRTFLIPIRLDSQTSKSCQQSFPEI